MLSCKEVCYIVSESQDGQLPWRERLRVRAHLLMCKACQQLVRQMELLRTVAHRYKSAGEETLHTNPETLSEEASTRILTRLRQAENEPTDHE